MFKKKILKKEMPSVPRCKYANKTNNRLNEEERIK